MKKIVIKQTVYIKVAVDFDVVSNRNIYKVVRETTEEVEVERPRKFRRKGCYV